MLKGDLTREWILCQAAQLVQTKGFGDTSVNDVLEATGATKGGFYYHFPCKDDLGLAILEQARGGFVEFLKDTLVGPTPWSRLANFFDTALSLHGRAGFIGGCLWGNTALEMSDKNSRYAKPVAALFERWVALIEEVIVEGQKSGEIRHDCCAQDLAIFTVSTIEGGIMLSRLHKTEDPLKTCFDLLKKFLRSTAA